MDNRDISESSFKDEIQLFREKILQAENEHLNDVEVIGISEARKRLHERVLENK